MKCNICLKEKEICSTFGVYSICSDCLLKRSDFVKKLQELTEVQAIRISQLEEKLNQKEL